MYIARRKKVAIVSSSLFWRIIAFLFRKKFVSTKRKSYDIVAQEILNIKKKYIFDFKDEDSDLVIFEMAKQGSSGKKIQMRVKKIKSVLRDHSVYVISKKSNIVLNATIQNKDEKS